MSDFPLFEWRIQAVQRIVGLALASAATIAHAALPIGDLRVPAGFTIELVTDQVPSAREMSLGPRNGTRLTVFVGSQSAGKVYAVVLEEGHAAAVTTIASGLQMPVGVAYRDGSLFVSAVSRILRIDHVDGDPARASLPIPITDRFPTETHHGWKFIAFGPDGDLYVPVGAPCNVCERDENTYYDIQKISIDGKRSSVIAKGVRNTVGFDWNPDDHSLWFTDNGRDMMGDDIPSDELNRVRAGQISIPHFGFPYCHQGDIRDPEFGKRDCAEFVAPEAKLGAHVASLGMRFYSPPAGAAHPFPDSYRNNIFIAEHGSWNRSKKVGYRVVRVVLDPAGKPSHQEVFAEGWLRPDESVWGRPVDVLPLPDGSLLVSDDYAGAIYRIRHD